MKKNIFRSTGFKIAIIFSLTMLVVGCNGNKSMSFTSTEKISRNGLNKEPILPEVGICGVENNSCLSGELEDLEDSVSEFLWQCNGLNEGPGASCSLPIDEAETPPVLADCVQVFYDDDGGLGRESALMLLNLLGHFPQYQQILGPIESYQAGDIERCDATFYLGTEYDNGLPEDFLEDFRNADMPVVWMGYNFWQLGESFEQDFGFQDYDFDEIDYDNLDSDGMPSFFRDVIYKGETFFKYNYWSPQDPNVLLAPDEMVILRNQISNEIEIMAEAQHSFTDEVVPWAIRATGRNTNKFFVAEVPFDYIHEADRYLVLADLLFDFLQEEPRHNAKYAVMRLDDVHPFFNRNILQEAVSILHDNNIQPTISLIPHFADPLFAIGGHAGVPLIRMEEDANFTADIERYISEGSVIIWNGVTHQYDETSNPFSGVSGDDFEFWNSVTDSPLAEDSVLTVLDRLDDGFESLKLSGVEPQVWVTPNYQASALDNLIFGQVFSWTLGRGFYFDHFATDFNLAEPGSSALRFIPEDDTTSQNRRDHFMNLAVTTTGEYFHQFYPYEIYGDIYSASVIPENLGNVQPFPTDQVIEPRTVDQMLENARRNLVLRDVWASMFYHLFLLDPDINPDNADESQPKDLERLVQGIQNLGYEFISVDDFASHHTDKAKPRLDIDETR